MISKGLLKLAKDDFEIAKQMLNIKKNRYTCFFAQQAVEKLLKYYLLRKNVDYPLTHSIYRLINLCSNMIQNLMHYSRKA